MRLGRFPDTIPSRKERLIVDLSARNLRPRSIRSGGSRTRGRGDRMSGYFFFFATFADVGPSQMPALQHQMLQPS
jgi:hypothetical protein